MNEPKSAIVAIIGRPSVGKSTFLNAACCEKVSIVSAVPQTTRNAVRGIVNGSRGQLVFIDTPGYHNCDKKLNLKLQSIATSSLSEADIVLYILDATRLAGEEEETVASFVAPFASKTCVAINKIDSQDAKPVALRQFIAKKLPTIPPERIFEISAKKDTCIDELLIALFELAPAGEALYPAEFYTDQEVDFRIAEIIREKAILATRDEIPHAIYVEISDMEMRKNGKEMWVRAFLVVERESQKGMVIGKGASLIKTIRLTAMKELNTLFTYHIDLDLQVKVNKNWRQKDPLLTRLIK